MNVNVSSDIIKKQIADLGRASSEIEKTRNAIISNYQHLGTTWKDKKYQELGQIVNESNASLRKIEKIFLQSQKALVQILQYVIQYEEANINSLYSGGVEAYINHSLNEENQDLPKTYNLTLEEVNTRYQSGLKNINDMIDNYREALRDRGIPECRWLNETLARHKANMTEQLGYDLDVASGHAEDSTSNPNAYLYPSDYVEFYDELANEFREYCLFGTNPNYNLGLEYRNNCQRCVPACEARRRGQDVEARPSTYGSSYLSYHPYDVWENADVLTTSGSGMENINTTMSEWGDGARAQVVVYWNSPLGGGHTFLAEQIDGRTVYTDPQTGNTNVINYFNRVISDRTTFCRIDDLNYSQYSRECF